MESRLLTGEALLLAVPDAGAVLGPYRHLTYPSWGDRTHFGVDIVAASGGRVQSVAPGIVQDVVSSADDRNFNSLGYMVIIRHPGAGSGGRDIYSMYLHLGDAPLVREEDLVGRGQQIGVVGATGAANGTPHVHFELRYFASRFSRYSNIYGDGDVRNEEYARDNWEDPESFAFRHSPLGGCPTPLGASAEQHGINPGAFEDAYSRERSAEGSPGCPATPAPDGAVASGVREVVHREHHSQGEGVVMQHLYQPEPAVRFSGGDGWSALVANFEMSAVFLIRSGFWGVYRCLADEHGRLAGGRYLGPPVSEEEERWFEFCLPATYLGSTPYNDEIDDLCRGTVTRQRFERGYMDWNGDRVYVHFNDPSLHQHEAAWAIVNTLAGCYPGFVANQADGVVVPNPPVAFGRPVEPAVRVVPPAGGRGALFQQDGTGFSLNGAVRLSFRYPDGSVAEVERVADGEGEYRHTYQSHDGTPTGQYRYWATDLTTGRQSPAVDFWIGPAVAYVDGFPYKGTDRPDVCYYNSGTCYVIESEPIYWQMFPGDIGFNRMVVIPQADFDRLVADAPCVVGADYYDPQEPGCIIHDTSLPGDDDYFIVRRGLAQRMGLSAAQNCFDPRRIFPFRLLAWAQAWHDDPRRFFEFEDTPEQPYYCDPTEPDDFGVCDECGRQRRGCDDNTCRPFAGECVHLCAADEECVEGLCQVAIRLTPGQVISPPNGAQVPNDGFEVRWEPGVEAHGHDTGTGLYCRVDGGPWDLMRGFGDEPTARLPDFDPSTELTCKVRTRLDSDHDQWVDSPEVTWMVSDVTGEIRITAMGIVEEHRQACDGLRIDVTAHNEGAVEASWTGRAWLHPAGADEAHPDAIEAVSEQIFGLLPGADATRAFLLEPGFPIPATVGAWEVTVILRDEFRGLGIPDRRTIPIQGADAEAPLVTRLDLYGIAGDPVGVIAGRTYTVEAGASDDYGLADFVAEWRQASGPWQPLAWNAPAAPCDRTPRLNAEVGVPGGLAVGTRIDVRVRATDGLGRSAERRVEAEVRAAGDPSIRFLAPLGGETYRHFFAGVGDCIPVRLAFAPGVPARSLSVGLGLDDERIREADVSINPVPQAAGLVETCVRASAPGDQVRVVARVFDDNRENHYFASEPITIEYAQVGAPFGPPWIPLEGTPRPAAAGEPAWGTRFDGPTLDGGELSIYRQDTRTTNDGVQQLVATRLDFVRQTRQLARQDALLPLTMEPQRLDDLELEDLRWTGIADDFQVFDDELVDRGCSSPGPCDFTLRHRGMRGGAVSAARELGAYVGLRRLTPLRPIDLNDGTQLLLVHARTADSTSTDVYLRAGANWALTRTHADEKLVDLLSTNGQVWAFVVREEGDVRVVQQVRLDPTTGAITQRVEVFRTPQVGGDYALWARHDPHRDTVHLAYAETQSRLWRNATAVGGVWSVHPPFTMPAEVRGSAVQAPYLSGLFVGGGAVLHYVQFQLAGIGLQQWYVPEDADGALEFDAAFKRPEAEPGFDESGQMVFVVRKLWNFENRLLIYESAAPRGCYDDNPCTEDSWDANEGECLYVERVCDQDGDACNGPEVCDPEDGVCRTDEAHRVVCDDGELCNGVEACDPDSGECLPGEPVLVDDGLRCTVDACDTQTGLAINTPDDDRCAAASCRTARCAPDADGASAETGCVDQPRPIPDDGIACTVGVCDPETGLGRHEPMEGACVIAGRCYAAGAPNPDNPCEVCLPETSQTRFSPAPAETPCDDGRFCTVADQCDAGVCRGAGRDCSAALEEPACQRAVCDEQGDTCRVLDFSDGTPCDDGDLCNGREACADGHCAGGQPPPQESANPCVVFFCDPVDGVSAEFTNAACDDGDPCTVGDSCTEGECLPSAAFDCSEVDGPCARGACVADRGAPACVAEAMREGEACDDNEACTADDVCANGVCAGGAYVCRAPRACEVGAGVCDGGGACAFDAAPNGSPCPGGTCTDGRCDVEGELCEAPLALVVGEPRQLNLSLAQRSPNPALSCFEDAPGPDVWLRAELQPGWSHTLIVRPRDDSALRISAGDGCGVGDGCRAFREVAGAPAELGPFVVQAVADLVVRAEALCCDAPEADVELRAVPIEPPCPDGTSGCPCYANDTCDDQLVCVDGRCGPPACEPGTANCACDARACNPGFVCTDDRCIAEVCPAGEAGCPCDAGSCVLDLTCANDVCGPPACPSGQRGCRCRGDGSCEANLVCDNAQCVVPDCPPGSLDCPCDAGACAAGLRCAMGRCETCPVGTLGCPCDGDFCDNGLACVDDICAEPACRTGTDGCPCRAGTCDDDLVCSPDGRCAPAPCHDGTPGCACYDNGTCDPEAVCEAGLCRPCPVGEGGCACYGNDTCNEGLRCHEAQCEVCPVGEVGCDCFGNGTCNAGLVCEDATCEVAPTVEADAGPAPTSDAALPLDAGPVPPRDAAPAADAAGQPDAAPPKSDAASLDMRPTELADGSAEDAREGDATAPRAEASTGGCSVPGPQAPPVILLTIPLLLALRRRR